MKVRRRDRFAVFELGEAPVGELDRSLQLVIPDAVIITRIASDHYRHFRGLDATAAEVSKAVRAIPDAGFVALNADDPRIAMMGSIACARVVTYGETPATDYRAIDIQPGSDGSLRFGCVHGDATVPFTVPVLGRHFLASVLGGIAVAAEYGIPLEAIARRAASYSAVPGRCSLHSGANGRFFVCDTAKAVESTLEPAFQIANTFKAASRRTIVIGTISDYAGASRPKYQKAYLAARAHADRVIMFGNNADRVRPLHEDVAADRFSAVRSIVELRDLLDRTAVAEEFVLLKASGKTDHVERVAMTIENPVGCWQDKCGRANSCFSCEMLRDPPPKLIRRLLPLVRRLRQEFSRYPVFD